MKTMKRILAFLLAFAMVVSGAYIVKPEGSEAKAETTSTTSVDDSQGATVEPGMLTVKVQSGKTEDGSVKALRFITSVNSLLYKEVGFVIDDGESEPIVWAAKDNTVFKRIQSSTEESYLSYTFSPKVVDTSAEYFATGKLNVTGKESTLYTVTAYVVTLENETVYGTSRCVSYEDATTTTYTNMSFVSSKVPTTEELAVTYGSANTEATATVIDSEPNANGDGTYNVHVRVPVNPKTLPSATQFTFGEDGSTIYRNLYSTASGMTGDSTWYNLYKDTSDEFVIANLTDLYGFEDLVDGKTIFTGKTVYLVSDITVNTVDVVEAAGTGVDNWPLIGGQGDTSAFNGVFDGQNHIISGISCNYGSSNNVGMFRWTGKDSTLKNFRMENCWVWVQGAKITDDDNGFRSRVGSVVGYCQGSIENVYSDATIEVGNERFTKIGGFAGEVADSKDGIKITGCQFAGQINFKTANNAYVGGIAGDLSKGSFEVRDCYNTGTISNTTATESKQFVGGIMGGVGDSDTASNTIALIVSNCLNDGAIQMNLNTSVGSIIGAIHNGGTDRTINIYNNYATTTGSSYTPEGAEEALSYLGVADGYKGDNVTMKNNIVMSSADNTLTGLEGYRHLGRAWAAVTGALPVLENFKDLTTATLVDTTDALCYDTSWYYEDDTTVEGYQIDNEDEFYGFAPIVNGGVTFSGATITLGDNMNLNPGWSAELDSESTGALKGDAPVNEWTPIGDYNNKFLGNLDGRGKTISGLYVDTNTQYAGLFGYAGDAGEGSVKNIQMINGYVKGKCTSGDLQAGSVAGAFGGSTIGNIYSEAYIVGEATTGKLVEIGGLVGRLNGSGNHRIDTCWFAGNVIQPTVISKAGSILGGIAARSNAGTNTIINCLNTGNVLNYFDKTSASGTENKNLLVKMGGILGTQTSSGDITINKCLNLGTVCALNHQFTGTTSERGAGPIVGTFSTDVIVNNTLWINVEHFDDKKNDDLCYGCDSAGNVEDKIANGSITLDANSKQYADENALITAVKAQEAAALVLDFSNTGEWTSVTINDNGTAVDMTPILKDFATWWLNYKGLQLYSE